MAVLTTIEKANYDSAVIHTESTHAPTNADKTSENETSHADVLVDGDVLSPITEGNKLLTQVDVTAYDDTAIQAEVDLNTVKNSYPTVDSIKLATIEEGAEVNDATTLLDADIDVTVQSYDVDTTKNDVANTFTEPQRTTVGVGANAIAFNSNQVFSFTATVANITVASQTVGQSGTFRVLISENITGWGAGFFWGTQGEPIELTGTQVFSYEVFDASGVDSIAIGIL